MFFNEFAECNCIYSYSEGCQICPHLATNGYSGNMLMVILYYINILMYILNGRIGKFLKHVYLLPADSSSFASLLIFYFLGLCISINSNYTAILTDSVYLGSTLKLKINFCP